MGVDPGYIRLMRETIGSHRHDRGDLAHCLMTELRRHLKLPDKYTDEIIRLNLPYLFAKDDLAASEWFSFVEQKFNVNIPDEEADIFFLSSVEEMAMIIVRNIK